jgi:PTS system nitrogen regulatory IIA component
MPEHQIMTIEEVADYLRVSERTVYEWAQKGEIPCGKLGTSWRFRRSEIERWVDDKLGTHERQAAEQTVVIRELLSPKRVLVSDVAAKKEALEALIQVLAGAPQVRDAVELQREVYRRERLMSTGIGCGIAVPHVRLATVEDIVMAASVHRRPVEDYESLDGQPVRIVLMVAAGKDQQAQYLKTLAAVSSRLKEEDFRDKLLNAQDQRQAYDLLVGNA